MKPTIFSLPSRILAILLCSITVFALSACMENAYNPDNGKGDKDVPNPFDFATTSTIRLNVKYDVPKGYQILFNVYFENPFTTDKDGQVVMRTDITPAVTRMTDETGAYSGKEIVDADHGNDVYIYTPYIGVPTLFKTNIENNVITANVTQSITDNAAQTRAGWNAPAGYYTLGNWTATGRPNYLDAEGTLTLSSTILNTINQTLPENKTCPDRLRQNIDFVINDKEGRDTEVVVRLIGGKSGAASAFGYYCYKTGDSKKEIEAAKKVIIFPNTILVSGYTQPALQGGESVKLHYFDKNGTDKGTIFPNGTKIGWFILNDAFRLGGEGNGAFYSTSELNSDKRTHTAAFAINDFIVFSFEDWNDVDYNDVIFNIWSNPIEAIITPELPSVEPSEPSTGGDLDKSIAYQNNYTGILAFEDNWPSKGDYDMNDVVVKYNSVLSYNTKNEVLSTEDTFTALWSGANYRNGFAYQMNTSRSNVTTQFISESTSASQGLDKNISTATINVFDDALEVTGNNSRTVTYKIKNTFNTPVYHETLGTAPYNPFIIVNGNRGREVHLINHAPTEKVNMGFFGTEKDLSAPNQGIYYVASESYPFAIHLTNAEKFNSAETEPIDQSFPKFSSWAKSNGTSDKDWYK